jgi:hypothetical protein
MTMKIKILLMMMLFISINSYSQNCISAISEPEFMQRYNQVAVRGSDETKLTTLMMIIPGRCFISVQVKKLAELFANDDYRYQFATEVYSSVLDKPNFYDVFDAFVSYSAVFRLNEFIHTLPAPLTNDYPVPLPPPIIKCEVKQDEFDEIKNSINKESVSRTQLALAKQIISAKKCFNCAQIKSLVGLMMFEDNKLDLAKYAYDYCTDKENYYTVNDAFSFTSSKEDLLNFIKSRK